MKHLLKNIYVKSACLGVLGYGGISTAIEVPDFDASQCRIEDTTTVLKQNAPRTPNYFFRPFPMTNRVSYASGTHNYILDLNTGKEIPVPGPYDPVPTPDETFMTVPAEDSKDARPDDGLQFYQLKTLEAQGAIHPLIIDSSLKGVYQSVGIIKSDNSSSVYRVITDQNRLSVQDYEATQDADGKAHIVPLMSKPTVLCPGLTLSLPMLSKDGKQVAALDVKSQETKIYTINAKTGECKEVFSLGITTGKVDFSFDNDSITYHVLNHGLQDKDQYFKVPSDSLAANVFVLKRSTGELSKLTNNTSSNSVYPAYRKDGKVVYLNHPKRSMGQAAPSTFVVADPDKVNKASFELLQKGTCNGVEMERAFNSLTALGGLWANLCSAYANEQSPDTAALNTLSLSPDSCKSLVSQYWDKYRAQVLAMPHFKKSPRVNQKLLTELTKEDLLAVCPTKAFASTGNTSEPEPPPTNVVVPPVPDTCFDCHQFPFDNWEALKEARTEEGNKPLIEEILRRVKLDKTDKDFMPRHGEPLSKEAIKMLENYLLTGKY